MATVIKLGLTASPLYCFLRFKSYKRNSRSSLGSNMYQLMSRHFNSTIQRCRVSGAKCLGSHRISWNSHRSTLLTIFSPIVRDFKNRMQFLLNWFSLVLISWNILKGVTRIMYIHSSNRVSLSQFLNNVMPTMQSENTVDTITMH